MSMFKTIGLITGGVVIGVVSSSILSSKGCGMDDILDKYMPGKNDNYSNNEASEVQGEAQTGGSKLSDESKTMLLKTMQAEGTISEIKEIIYTDSIQDAIHKVNELDEIVSEMKNIITPISVDDEEDELDDNYEGKDIDEIVQEVVNDRDERIERIANEVIHTIEDEIVDIITSDNSKDKE